MGSRQPAATLQVFPPAQLAVCAACTSLPRATSLRQLGGSAGLASLCRARHVSFNHFSHLRKLPLELGVQLDAALRLSLDAVGKSLQLC